MTAINDRHRWAHKSFTEALDRWEIRRRTDDADHQATALAEVLWWSVALFDTMNGNANWAAVLSRPRQPPKTGTEADLVKGVRWARNRVGHQLINATVVAPGAALPASFPSNMKFHHRWQRASELPTPPKKFSDPTGEAAYIAHVQDRTVAGTILELRNLFRELMKD